MNIKKILSIILLFILGVVLFLTGYVYSASEHIPPHFHANFAMYVGGERVDFTGVKYSEDVAGCSITGEVMPKDRVHLHENNPDTIHVHASGVAWGHFFTNNGFSFGDHHLSLDTGDVYVTWEGMEVRYVLNGKIVKNPFNKAIKSEDRLLIAYGDEDVAGLISLYEKVSDNAPEYNSKYDPGSCGGTNENGILVILREFVNSFHNMDH